MDSQPTFNPRPHPQAAHCDGKAAIDRPQQELLTQAGQGSALSTLLLRHSRALYARFVGAYSDLLALSRQRRRKMLRRLGTSLTGAALALALTHAPSAYAVPNPVGGNAHINGTDCDLIDAITAANTDTATGGCAAGNGADNITLLSDVTLTAINNNTYGYTGLPVVSSQITIEGDDYTISRSGATKFRLLAVATTGNLTLHEATLTGGDPYNALRGGGLYNKGTATVTNSTFTGNNADRGGAIANFNGTLTLTNSTLSGNTTSNRGAGLYNGSSGTTTTAMVSNSTISGNTVNNSGGRGGGIYSGGTNTTLTVTNSTITGNNGGPRGGGVYARVGTQTVTNSTITGNSATTSGGGLYSRFGTATVQRTLISGNTATNGAELFWASGDVGSITVANFNLFGHNGLTNAQAFSGVTPSGSDITATSDGTTPTALANILNTVLADNAGDTLTHALVANSPAVNAATSGPATDQRSLPRPQGAAFDIGALEGFRISNSVTQTGVTTSNNPTPQNCPATGTSLAISTITPTFQNSSTNTFTDLFLRVKTLEYTTPQGGAVPSLCNATTVVNNGGVGSLLAVPNSSLQGSDNQFNPGDILTQVFQIGRPVAAQFRIKVDLFSSIATAAGNAQAEEGLYLGSFEVEFDENGQVINQPSMLFLPWVMR